MPSVRESSTHKHIPSSLQNGSSPFKGPTWKSAMFMLAKRLIKHLVSRAINPFLLQERANIVSNPHIISIPYIAAKFLPLQHSGLTPITSFSNHQTFLPLTLRKAFLSRRKSYGWAMATVKRNICRKAAEICRPCSKFSRRQERHLRLSTEF